jgi:intracellular multiplication protein IcmP
MARQQQGQESSGMEGLYYSAFIVIFFGAIWYYHKNTVVTTLFTVSLYQAYAMVLPLQLLNDVYMTVITPMGIATPLPDWLSGELLADVIMMITTTPVEEVTAYQLGEVMQTVGLYFAAYTTPVWAALSIYLLFFDAAGLFRNIYSLETLRTKESQNWPYICTVTGQDMLKKDLDEGVFAMSQQPMQFAKVNKILDHQMINGQSAVTVNRVRAHQVFTLQMGPMWHGNLQGFPPHVLALFAAFAAKAEHDTDTCNKLLRQIAESSANGNKNLNYSGTYAILGQHLKSMRIAKAVGPHAYLLPAMASLLELARDDGVLAAAEFLWLKTIDRPLWYMLNSVGRRTAFAEVAGPFGHWVVEKRLRRPLQTPMIEEAINGLEEAVAEVIYKPDDE